MKLGVGLMGVSLLSLRARLRGGGAVVDALAAPPNLFSTEQSTFVDTAYINFRGNWEVQDGRLVCTGANAGQAARLSLADPLITDRAHFILADHEPTAGSLRMRFASPGITNSRQLTETYMDFEYVPATDVIDPASRLDLQPSSNYAGSVGNVRVYDLSTVDPNTVACDVIIVGGDSNSANATSERFGDEIPMSARETPFDPRIWYVPCLRQSGTYPTTDSTRHIPQPCIEPVATVEARRMSPVHAVAGELVEWSAARGRPLLVMALGDPGSGLARTEDWVKGSTVEINGQPTGSRMYDEMLAMKAAVDALGPDHEIVGMVWSMGANDLYGGDYTIAGQWMEKMVQFVANVRADVADVPMALWSIGFNDAATTENDGRGAAMLAAQQLLDQSSGDPTWALDRFRVVVPEAGNELSDADDPHFTAHGMQQNGRDAGQALLDLLNNAGPPAPEPEPEPEPDNTVTFQGEPITFQGEPLTFGE